MGSIWNTCIWNTYLKYKPCILYLYLKYFAGRVFCICISNTLSLYFCISFLRIKYKIHFNEVSKCNHFEFFTFLFLISNLCSVFLINVNENRDSKNGMITILLCTKIARLNLEIALLDCASDISVFLHFQQMFI